MKLTDADKLSIFNAALTGLVSQRISKCPPARDGTQKNANVPFATACWALSFARAAVYVIEKEGAEREEQPAREESSSWK